jgi:hypothetical protein
MKHFPALLAGALMTLASNTQAAAPTGPVVVELFTSQGCNSCPPADALLTELARRPDVLALALHVTYWNNLGWQDVFSQPQFDERQRRYAQQTGRGSSYTPQMMVNGTEDVVGSQRDAVNRALAKAARTAAIALQKDGETLQITLPALEKRCDCVLTLFGVRPSAQTPVGRGENSGKTLPESRIVRDMQTLGSWQGEQRTLQVKLNRMSADVSAYAVLAQVRNSVRVVAAGQME